MNNCQAIEQSPGFIDASWFVQISGDFFRVKFCIMIVGMHDSMSQSAASGS
jgi:hypothetical protein